MLFEGVKLAFDQVISPCMAAGEMSKLALPQQAATKDLVLLNSAHRIVTEACLAQALLLPAQQGMTVNRPFRSFLPSLCTR